MKWTLEEQRVIRLFAGKLQAHHIANSLPSRTTLAVQHQAKKMGVSLKALGAYHHRAKYDIYQRAHVLLLRKQGKTYPQMVEATGMPKSAIQYILNTERPLA